MRNKKYIGYWSVFSIGVGGMVGGGIFAVLGLSVQLTQGGAPIAFALAGFVALVTSYSYVHLSVTYPSKGGTVKFLNQGFGTGLFSGGINVLLWISYIVMLSLYAYAFGTYGSSFFSIDEQPVIKHILISFIIILFTALNVLSANIIGKAEELVVGIKIIILLFFVGVGLWSIELQKLEPTTWGNAPQLLAGGMIIFLAYEGFELIANTAGDVKNPRKTLPVAFYSAVIFVIVLYVLVALVTVGNLPIEDIVTARDYALAESAKPFLGNFGFILITIAALLSTGSAINATLYGTTRISYTIAKDGELPKGLEKKVWNRPIEGLFITSGLTLVIANLFDLSSISLMGSAGFLLIFAAVNGSNVVLYKKTASNRWISSLGVIICLSAFGILIWQRATTEPNELLILLLMITSAFTIEAIYKKITGRNIRPLRLKNRNLDD